MKYLIAILMIAFSLNAYSQTYEPLRDKASEAQEKRQVYHSWGDWRPSARRVLGVPTNPAYFLVWQFSSTNRRYRRGEDIRPLKEDGEETQRTLLNVQYKNTSKKLLEETEQLKETNLKEFLHITKETAKTDPLYLIYYRKRLTELREIEDFNSFKERYFHPYISGMELETLENYYEEFQVLQDKYNGSFEANMDRGKRILNYHDIMLDLRKLGQKIQWYKESKQTSLRIKTKIRTKYNRPNEVLTNSNMNDRELFIRMTLNNPDFY